MTFQILVVCAANVCRSPMAELILEQTIARAGLGADVMVLAAGVDARSDQTMCRVMAAYARKHGLNPKEALERAPLLLRSKMIENADLVLTADRSVRAATLRMRPDAQGRTFTIRQAVALGESAAADWDPPRLNITESLRRFTAAMGEQRGMTELPVVSNVRHSRAFWKKTGVHSYDIPDAHGPAGGLHRTTAGLLFPSTEALAVMLSDAASVRVSS